MNQEETKKVNLEEIALPRETPFEVIGRKPFEIIVPEMTPNQKLIPISTSREEHFEREIRGFQLNRNNDSPIKSQPLHTQEVFSHTLGSAEP